MDKELIHKLVRLVTAGASVRGNMAEGALLLVDATGYDSVSIYALNKAGSFFILKAHAGAYSEYPTVPRVACSTELVEKLNSGKLTAVEKDDSLPFTNLNTGGSACIYPLGSKESSRGFLLLRGAASATEIEKEALLSVASSVLSMALKCEEMVVENEHLSSKAAEAKERVKGFEKFLYLGDMAAMLAHEIKNPLISIGGFAARLKKNIEPGSIANKYMDQMTAEIRRVEKITDAAFRCMEDESMEFAKEDLVVLLRGRIDLFEDEFKQLGITVLFEIDTAPMLVMADREQLKIAFDNLITNAIQSMAGGGSITFCARRDSRDIVVDITDSGGGIKEGTIGSVFNPFYTTKKGGTGLGLPISKSIIRRHSGEIEVFSNSGVGTTFRVRLKGCKA